MRTSNSGFFAPFAVGCALAALCLSIALLSFVVKSPDQDIGTRGQTRVGQRPNVAQPAPKASPAQTPSIGKPAPKALPVSQAAVEKPSAKGASELQRTTEKPLQRILSGTGEPEMVIVPESEFLMGTSETHPEYRPLADKEYLRALEVLHFMGNPAWSFEDETPARKVRLNAYAIDRFEVTNAQYRKFFDWIRKTGDHGRCHPGELPKKDHTPRHWRSFNPLLEDANYARTAPFSRETFTADEKPVVGVDWFDAFAYAAWAGKRLPTEAEWERAARGQDGRRWPWGNQWQWGLANIGGEKKGQDVSTKSTEKDGFIYPAPVGSFKEGMSPAGCYDLAGNAAEWCSDWYQGDYYKAAPTENPQGPDAGKLRVVRGGSSQNLASSVRCAKRFSYEPDFRSFSLGFRCVKDF